MMPPNTALRLLANNRAFSSADKKLAFPSAAISYP